jgi:hypothetical protein
LDVISNNYHAITHQVRASGQLFAKRVGTL